MVTDPALCIFLNKGLNMSTGKAAAMAMHAAILAYRLSGDEFENNLTRLWFKAKHNKVIVYEARDETHIRNIEQYLTERGFKVAPYIDEGVTEVEPLSYCALGVELINKNDKETKEVFEAFELYKHEHKIMLPNLISGEKEMMWGGTQRFMG